ncbi:helix-turn-helix domain-containing protein [Tenacibaculum agarivorans]|uniref:helix-turn-helix domain-containing protein n=1 Tax=Tenacibaculum agarivorans TaxID=1908389 RepID=UPI00117D6FD0|nr:AraC family transcriptional regulator [Tenacibaculum agarivorans]
MILAIALNNLQSWLLTKNFFLLQYIQVPWHFLITPAFYIFLLHYLNIREKFFDILKVIIPFFLISIIIQVVYLSFSKDFNGYSEYALVYEQYTAIEELISFIVSLILFFYSYYILKYKTHLFKDILSYDNLKWLSTFIVLGGICHVLWATAVMVKFYLNFENFIHFYYPLRVMTTILIYWLGYELVSIARQIKERKSIRERGIKKASKPHQENAKKFIEIENYIIEHRRFLDNTLSLETLSNELQMSTSSVSKLINEQTSQNFNYLLNSFRVEFSKKLLLDTTYGNYTITSIALESGFNSKSTFYSAFKKHANSTPTEFRKKQNN